MYTCMCATPVVASTKAMQIITFFVKLLTSAPAMRPLGLSALARAACTHLADLAAAGSLPTAFRLLMCMLVYICTRVETGSNSGSGASISSSIIVDITFFVVYGIINCHKRCRACAHTRTSVQIRSHAKCIHPRCSRMSVLDLCKECTLYLYAHIHEDECI